MEWLTIIAIVVGPFLGIWAHGKLEDRKRVCERKLDIFKTLMATRATPLAREHVESLNRIDIEFTGRKEKKVREAWAVLLDHYGQGPTPPIKPLPGQPQAEHDSYARDFQKFTSAQERWGERVIELRAALLREMGVIFKYEFDEVKIKKAIYYPKLHGDVETEQLALLAAANDVLLGNRYLAMYVVNWPTQADPSKHEMRPE